MEIKISELEEMNDKLDLVMKKLDGRINDPKYVVLDRKQLMDYLSIGRTKLYELTIGGKISHSKDEKGKTWYKLSDVIEYIDSIRQEKF